MKAGKGRTDLVLNILCLLLIIGVAAFLAAAWGHIPEQVASHYSFSGEADRFGPKSGLVTVWVIVTAACVLLTAIERIPKSAWNTAFAVTGEERGRVYALTVRCLNSVKLWLALLFAYCVVTSALGAGFSVWLALALTGAELGTVFYLLGRIIQVGKKS